MRNNNWQTTVVTGAQWGDEGKGKITDYYAKQADYVVRFQGGNNAGHTLKLKDKIYKLHLLPSGVLYNDKKVVIGNGVVIDPAVLLSELKNLGPKKNKVDLLISERAHVIFPFHVELDGAMEIFKKKLAAGTTRRGIGPAYADKMERIGVRVVDLINPQTFKKKFDLLYNLKTACLDKVYQQKLAAKKNKIFNDYLKYGRALKKYAGDVSLEIDQAYKKGKKILFEGAQGALLDIDHGVYPHTTSSNTIAGAVCSGVGIGPRKIGKIIGVVKAYLSRVGESPLPTEQFGETAHYLREKGAEYGTTTGRPRRVGWLDLVQLRYAVRLNGYTSLAITKIDVLNGLKEIPVCTHYKAGKKNITELPADLELFARCRAVYKIMPGWPEISEKELPKMIKRGLKAFPVNFQKYVRMIERELGVPVELVSVGAERNETIAL